MAGITDEEMAAVTSDDYMDSPHLSDREKAAVLWTEHVTLNTAKFRDDVFEQVKAQFNEPEIVEMTMLCSFRNMRNRFHDSLQVDMDPPSGAASVGAGSQVDPSKLKAYVEVLINKWPTAFPKAPKE